MTNKQLLLRIQSLFEQKLQAKTSWGRIELMGIYKEAVSEAIMETLE